MRFGTCINYLEDAKTGYAHAARLAAAGFDFLEGNLTALSAATRDELISVRDMAKRLHFSLPVCNCMFPRDIRLTGPQTDAKAVGEYVEEALSKAAFLGVEKVVMGSDKSRQLPDGYDPEAAYAEFSALVGESMAPIAEKYGVVILIEPLRRPCNFINTLEDGMRVVNAVNSPWVQLLADTIHIITSGEDVRYIHSIPGRVRHVHVSDWNRALPEFSYSSELTAILREIKRSGYDGDFSFEASAGRDERAEQRALLLLKQKLGAAK